METKLMRKNSWIAPMVLDQGNAVSPKVEYSLAKKGKTLIPILDCMSEWGDKNKSPRQ